jgi:ribonuclease T2
MKNALRLSALAAVLVLAPAARAQQGPVAANYQSYVFVLEWLPEFCAKVHGSAECASLSSSSFAANHPVLHGLWPNQVGDTAHDYGYCGDAAAQKPLDRNTTWCQLQLPTLSTATRTALDQYMPGTASCLEHHEWTKHGTCSGLSADAYFAAEASLGACPSNPFSDDQRRL